MAKCKSCNAEIIWAVTESGKRMPLDADPTTDGNVEVYPGEQGLTAVVVTEATRNPGMSRRYVSHFATCPESGKHRKG